MAAVSSTDSVVCVTKASLAGSRGAKASASAAVSIRVDGARRQLAHGADDLGMPGVADEQDLRPCSWWRAASICTLETSGQVASRTNMLRALAAAGTALATPCAEKITGWSVSGMSSSSSTKTAPLAFRESTTNRL